MACVRTRLFAGLIGSILFVSPAFPQGKPSVNITPTDCSGSIAVGGTAQNALTASSGRQGFQIQNLDTTEPLWVSFTGTAAANGTGSFALSAATATTLQNGGSYYTGFGFNHAVSVVAATGTHKFSCTAW